MKTPIAKTLPRERNADGVLEACAGHGIRTSNPQEVGRYLTLHPELSALLEPICKKVQLEFGAEVELSLELYQDPESDDSYLTLFVRQVSYDANIIDRIDAACGEFRAQLEIVPGYFLVTTDFRRPGRVHVV
jgi:hypothetical protein